MIERTIDDLAHVHAQEAPHQGTRVPSPAPRTQPVAALGDVDTSQVPSYTASTSSNQPQGVVKHMHGFGRYARITDMDTHGYKYGSDFGYPCIHVFVSADPCLDPWRSQTIYFAQKG